MIRKVLMTTAALVAIGGTALAADLPSRRAPPVYLPPPMAFSWTGLYVGGQVGYAFGRDRTDVENTVDSGPAFQMPHETGVVGGAHIGYNYALTGFGPSGIVVGVEGDVDGTNNKTSFNEDEGFAEYHKSRVEGSIRGRVGYAVDRALFYVTGGVALASFADRYVTPADDLGFDTTRVGWTVGGGVEYAISQNWSLRGEYRYSDFSKYGHDVSSAFPGAVNAPITGFYHPVEERVQLGFSYKFAPTMVPVVARY